MMTVWKWTIFLVGFSAPLYPVRWEWLGIPWNISTILSLCAIGIWCIRRKSSFWRDMYAFRDPLVWLFVGWLSLGVMVSDDIRSSLGMWGYVGIIPLVIAVIIGQNTTGERLFIKGLVLGGVWLSLLSIGQILLFGDMFPRPVGLYQWGLDPNLSGGGFANYIGMFLVPLVFLVEKVFGSPTRWLVMGTLIVGVLGSQSLSAIGSLGIVGTIALLLRYKPTKHQWVLIGVGTILVSTLFVSWQIQTPKIQYLFDMNERNSLSSRVQIWQASVILIQEAPIEGIGLVDYERRYQEVIPQVAFPPHEWIVPHPHNLVGGIWLMGGIVGFIWIGLVIIRVARAVWIQYPAMDTHLFALLSIGIIGLIDFPFGRIDIMILLWMLLGSFLETKKNDDKIEE